METEPNVETGPPALIESAVRLIIPPVAREHVLGDLAERYESPWRYVLEAARTVPFVVASQIRRTSNFVFWPMIALMLASGFAPGLVSWVRGAIPALATLIGFMLRDAYRVPDLRHPWRQGVVDVTVAAGAVLASQVMVAAVRPGWLIEREGIIGGALVLAVIYLLRVQNPTGRVPHLVPASAESAMTIDELRGEIATYDRHLRRGAWIETVSGLVVVPIFAATVLFAPLPLVRIGAGLELAGVLFVIWIVQRVQRTPAAPNDVDFAATAASYRARLEDHHRALQTIWLWYLLPLTIGAALMLGAGVPTASQPAETVAGILFAFTLIWLSVIGLAVQKGRAVRQRMLVIEHVEEQR